MFKALRYPAEAGITLSTTKGGGRVSRTEKTSQCPLFVPEEGLDLGPHRVTSHMSYNVVFFIAASTVICTTPSMRSRSGSLMKSDFESLSLASTQLLSFVDSCAANLKVSDHNACQQLEDAEWYWGAVSR